MSRSGYSGDYDGEEWELALWRGTVASSIRGKRGQAFLRELVEALDALSEKRLIKHDLIVTPADMYGPPTRVEYYREYNRSAECGVCAIGSVGLKRGVDRYSLDPEDYDAVGRTFNIASPLVREIEYLNDEDGYDYIARRQETPEERWQRIRDWAASNLKATAVP